MVQRLDIGLMTIKTDAGMLVAARSLKSALPLPGVQLRLVSRSNDILGTYTSDADGRTLIPGGMFRGEGGDTPKILAASSPRGDYSWLQLDTPALDLTDLDLKGRAPPGPLDAFLWTDRGIYRPGEIIHLGTLLRDQNGKLPPATPLTLHLVRPDGIEAEELKPDLASGGAARSTFTCPTMPTAATGRSGPGLAARNTSADTTVSVQDFVPPRLEAKVDLPAGQATLGGAISPVVEADYFYGSPGADLSGQVEATIQAAAKPFEGLGDYQFGLVQDPFLPKAIEAQDFTTDDKGRATVTLPQTETPDTSGPLEIALRATVNDIDGRAATAERTAPLKTADRFIGLRTTFGSGVAENADAGFDIVLVDGNGKPIGPAGVKWDLVKEDYEYNTYYRDGRWQSEETVIDSRENGGDLALGSDGRGHLQVQVGVGRYRLEAYDGAGKTASSIRFGAGWWGSASAENRKPDVLPVTIDASAPAGTVRARIEPAFAGRVLVMLDGNGLHQVRELDMPKGGATVEFDATDVPGRGRLCCRLCRLAVRRRDPSTAGPRRRPRLGSGKSKRPHAWSRGPGPGQGAAEDEAADRSRHYRRERR